MDSRTHDVLFFAVLQGNAKSITFQIVFARLGARRFKGTVWFRPGSEIGIAMSIYRQRLKPREVNQPGDMVTQVPAGTLNVPGGRLKLQ